MKSIFKILVCLSILSGCAANPDTKQMTMELKGGATFVGTGGIHNNGYIPIKGMITYPNGDVFEITRPSVEDMPGNLTTSDGIEYSGILLDRVYSRPTPTYGYFLPYEVHLKNDIVIRVGSQDKLVKYGSIIKKGRGEYYLGYIDIPGGTKITVFEDLYLGIGSNPENLQPFMFSGEVVIDGDYSNKHLVSTSQPLDEWPTNLQNTAGIKSGYYGLLKNGAAFGSGSFLHDDGVLTVGSFKSGSIDGKATQYMTDGSVLSGNYVKGYKHGEFTHTLPDKSTWGGRLVQDKKDQWWFHKNVQQSLSAGKVLDNLPPGFSFDELKKAANGNPEKIVGIIESLDSATLKSLDSAALKKMQKALPEGFRDEFLEKITGKAPTIDGAISEIEYFNNGSSVERISLNNTLSCQLLFAGKQVVFQPTSDQCSGTLFSVDSGTLLRDAEVVADQVVNAKTFVVFKHGYQGIVSDLNFEGIVFNKKGGIDYNGTIQEGLRDGAALCGYEHGVERCLYRKGERIDEVYLARVEGRRIGDWASACQNNLSQIKNTNQSILQGDETCSATNYKKKLDYEYNRDLADGVSDDTSYVQTFIPVEKANKCIVGLKLVARARQEKINARLSHLRENQCIYPSQVSQLRQMTSESMKINNRRINEFEKMVSGYERFAIGLKRARKKSLNSFYDNLNRDTHNYIVNRLGSIQSDVNKVTRDSQRQYDQILKEFGKKQPKNFEKFERSNQRSVTVSSKAPQLDRTANTGVKIKNSAKTLRVGKNKCLSLNGGTWKNDGCVFVVPYTRDKLCYDPSGKICKTGERWNPDNGNAKSLSTASSGSSNFTGYSSGADNSTGSSGKTSSFTENGSKNFQHKKLAPLGSTTAVSDIDQNGSISLQCASNNVGCRDQCKAEYEGYCDSKPSGNGTNNCLNNEYLPLISKCQKACFSPYKSICDQPSSDGGASSVDQ